MLAYSKPFEHAIDGRGLNSTEMIKSSAGTSEILLGMGSFTKSLVD